MGLKAQNSDRATMVPAIMGIMFEEKDDPVWFGMLVIWVEWFYLRPFYCKGLDHFVCSFEKS
ncbi:hypothetical protein HanRHA438_Chr09g0408061 [Helianthus annuus]|nr:hypothetical protein HanRHA438_Chr09g0408061 [Helianthus annuus]